MTQKIMGACLAMLWEDSGVLQSVLAPLSHSLKQEMKQKFGEVGEGRFLVASRIPTQFPKLPPYPKVLGKAIVAFFYLLPDVISNILSQDTL